jgi:hypothetical protein
MVELVQRVLSFRVQGQGDRSTVSLRPASPFDRQQPHLDGPMHSGLRHIVHLGKGQQWHQVPGKQASHSLSWGGDPMRPQRFWLLQQALDLRFKSLDPTFQLGNPLLLQGFQLSRHLSMQKGVQVLDRNLAPIGLGKVGCQQAFVNGSPDRFVTFAAAAGCLHDREIVHLWRVPFALGVWQGFVILRAICAHLFSFKSQNVFQHVLHH